MDNLAEEAYAVSCILPLIAFILLSVQFYNQTSQAKTQNAPSCLNLEEFPCHMGGLISITTEAEPKERRKLSRAKELDCSSKINDDMEKIHKKYLYTIGR